MFLESGNIPEISAAKPGAAMPRRDFLRKFGLGSAALAVLSATGIGCGDNESVEPEELADAGCESGPDASTENPDVQIHGYKTLNDGRILKVDFTPGLYDPCIGPYRTVILANAFQSPEHDIGNDGDLFNQVLLEGQAVVDQTNVGEKMFVQGAIPADSDGISAFALCGIQTIDPSKPAGKDNEWILFTTAFQQVK